MKIAILDLDTLTAGELDFSPIEALGEVVYYDSLPKEKVIDACRGADAVLVNKAEMSREVIEALPELKYIGVFATGYNNIDVSAARERAIDVVNVPGYSTDSVAQLIITYILTFATSLPDYNASVHRGEWISSSTFSYFPYRLTELAGKTFGIIGYGAIGKKVTSIASALGMNVIVYTKSEHPECPYVRVGRDEVFAKSDYLALCCPLNDGTRNIVNRETLSKMKPTSFLVNTSRGGCVDSQALCDALNAGRIAGAAVDVLVQEPMAESEPLFRAKNIYFTPHIAWATIEARERLIKAVAANLANWQNGTSTNVVNK